MSMREELQDRVRELVKEEEFDEYLPESEEALPWGLICSGWAGLALISAVVALVRAEWVIAGILALIAPLLVALSPVKRTAHQRRRHRLGRKGRIVAGAVAQVHSQ